MEIIKLYRNIPLAPRPEQQRQQSAATKQVIALAFLAKWRMDSLYPICCVLLTGCIYCQHCRSVHLPYVETLFDCCRSLHSC